MGYAFKDYNSEHMARAIGISLPISTKQSYEVCNFVRNKKVSEAKKMLQDVVDKKRAVPYRRYDFDLGHKKEVGPGRFPMKTSTELLKLIQSAESNAQFKGLSTANLTIVHISAHKASKSWHYGRKSRRKMKRTTIEVVLQEKTKSDSKKHGSKGEKKETKETKKE